jgi:hypothetical protein
MGLCLNSLLPLHVSASGILMILAALGAVAGLFFFFHGFSVLQERRLSSARAVAKVPAHTATLATTYATKGADLKRASHAEVIQLTPLDNPVNDSASMTQQGKIAAALLKAGIPNPVIWSAQPEVRVIDPPSGSVRSEATKEADVSRVLQQGATAEPVHFPSLQPTPSMGWKARLMIWGGPALTLACIYTLAAHFGWL